jgi:ketosteroid isomerase-like protein
MRRSVRETAAGVWTPILIAALAASPVRASAQEGAASRPSLSLHSGSSATTDSLAVAAVVERYHRALAAGDSAAALALLAPDAVVLESGDAETRAEYASHHLPADMEFARAVARTPGAVRVVVRGDAAWATSASRSLGSFRGRAIDAQGVELMVLSREPGGWAIRAIHWSSRPRKETP